jgi:tetratricopeptide (TPR) repeat protein
MSRTGTFCAFALTLLVCACASKPDIRIKGAQLADPEAFLYRPAAADGRPQLSFCVTEGRISNDFRGRNGSVRESSYYQTRFADMLKADAPFSAMEYIGDSEKYDCDVLISPYLFIYVTPLGKVQARASGTALAVDEPDRDLFYGYMTERSDPEETMALFGRYIFNAFAPGSELYGELAARNTAKTASFEEEAGKYRELAVKPELPEEARKLKVQAEAAVRRKEFGTADARYLDALKIAPWWPEGHFNRALILGEMSRYRNAIEEMTRYLILVPDAPDARAAKDKIYEWEDLAR